MARTNLQLYGVLSSVFFVATVLNAFRERSNFYSAAVYLSKSNACTMVLWNQGIYLTTLFGKLLQAIFFGELRPHEVERLQERGWFAVTETLLALTIFREEFDTYFILFFVSLLFLKVFHWLIADRIEIMEQAPELSRLFHTRITGLLMILWAADLCFLAFAAQSLLNEGPSVMIMFASEYMILVATIWSTTMKYGINIVDLRTDDTWEEKSMFVFYVDLATDFFKLVTYITFFALILTFYGLPLNILRDVYITLRSFILKCRDLRRYRRATNNMNELYPDASREEMTNMVDRTCIICREDMEYRGPPEGPVVGEDGEAVPVQPPPPPSNGPNDTPKKLPCGHVFHFHCLRSWLERQQSCPTCRRPVLASEQVRPPTNLLARPPAGAPQAEQEIWRAQINIARNLGREGFANVFPGLPFPPEADLPRQPIAAPAGPIPAAPLNGAAPPPVLLPNPLANGFPPPPSTTAPPNPADNPLAHFSLKNLRLPPTGEAGLYSQPDVLSGYAGVAYGASQAGNIGGRKMTTMRMSGSAQKSSVGVDSNGGLPRPAIPSTSTATTDPAISSTTDSTTTDPTSTTTDSPSSKIIDRLTELYREADAAQAMIDQRLAEPINCLSNPQALDMAQARLRRANSRIILALDAEKLVIQGFSNTPTAESKEGSTPSTEETSNVEKSDDSNEKDPFATSGFPIIIAKPAPSRAKLNLTTETAYPRLIPLFDPASPYSTTSFPHLLARLPPSLQGPTSSFPRSLPTTDLFPTASGAKEVSKDQGEELAEIGVLTKGLLEGKLRTIMRYQLEMERLAKEMKSEVEGITVQIVPVENEQGAEGGETVEEKGKAPVEGIRAVALAATEEEKV